MKSGVTRTVSVFIFLYFQFKSVQPKHVVSRNTTNQFQIDESFSSFKKSVNWTVFWYFFQKKSVMERHGILSWHVPLWHECTTRWHVTHGIFALPHSLSHVVQHQNNDKTSSCGDLHFVRHEPLRGDCFHGATQSRYGQLTQDHWMCVMTAQEDLKLYQFDEKSVFRVCRRALSLLTRKSTIMMWCVDSTCKDPNQCILPVTPDYNLARMIVRA